MKKTLIITGIIAAVAIIALIVINKVTSGKDISNLYAEAKRGQFDIVVTTTGELQAEQSIDIVGPTFAQSRNIRAMDIKITDLVPEGTEIKAGDYVATLDRTSFDNSLKDELEKLATYETNLEVKILDTAVTLSNLRDNIKNLGISVEEAEITLQQSKYEPPTTIRQAEIALDKSKRTLDQAIRGYSLKTEQAKAEMRNIKNDLSDQRKKVGEIQEVLSKFVITSPSSGMVIYKRDRSGSKRKIGSSISPWDNVVATLPDLSKMISKTYVNEIDVSKVKPDQKVEIVVDAFPDKKYTGSVLSVANIGEQLPNADAKVFEVVIRLDGSDPILRPSMTTGNKIVTQTINDVIYVPLESVQAGADSIPFVYMKNGTKQVVILGESNENNVIVEKGLAEGTTIYLNTPENPEDFKLVGEELIATLKERAKAKAEAELQRKQEIERATQNRPGDMMNMSPEMMQRLPDMRGGAPGQGGQGRPRDTAAMRKFVQMRNQRGGLPGGTRRAQDQRTPATQETTVNR